MNEKFSLLDAFLSLDSFNDDEYDITETEKSIKTEKLKESKSFDIRSSSDMEEAQRFIEKPIEEVTLEVVDPNANDLEHVVDKKEYIGNIILQCPSCHGTMFISDTDLKKGNEEGLFNLETECPTCHNKGQGFTILGRVAKREEENETKVENDSLTDETKFENDVPEEVKTEDETPVEPEADTNEQPEEVESDNEDSLIDSESDGMDSAEDDTADMEDVTGTLIDDEDVPYDDTEENDVEQEEEVEPIEPEEEDEEEPKRKKIERPKEDAKESLNEDVEDIEPINGYDFFEDIVDSEDIESIKIFDSDSDDVIYEGTMDGIPESLLEKEIVSFNYGTDSVVVNINSAEPDGYLKLKNTLVRLLDDFAEIVLWDQYENDEVYRGSKQTVLDEYGDYEFVSLEKPVFRLELTVKDALQEGLKRVEVEQGLNPTNPVDELTITILELNGLDAEKVNKNNSTEKAVYDCIKNKEDLSIIFNKFVKPLQDNILIGKFKEITGFREAADDLLDEDVEIVEGISQDDAIKQAKELLKQNEKAYAIIYGYNKGGFKPIKEPQVVETERELGFATELVKRKYRPTGSVQVLYKYDIQTESVDYKTRKELSEAILECQNNHQPYTVKRSEKEGYRYTLIKEECSTKLVEDTNNETTNNEGAEIKAEMEDEISSDEYESTAKKFIDYIKNDMSPEEARAFYYDDYKFDKFKPSDDVEKEIADALKTKISLPKNENLNEEEETPAENVETEITAPEKVVETPENVEEIATNLVADEQEAIKGYEEAKDQLDNVEAENKEDIVAILNHIQEEEEKHIDEIEQTVQLANGEIQPEDVDLEKHDEEKAAEEAPVDESVSVCPNCGKEVCECDKAAESLDEGLVTDAEIKNEVVVTSDGVAEGEIYKELQKKEEQKEEDKKQAEKDLAPFKEINVDIHDNVDFPEDPTPKDKVNESLVENEGFEFNEKDFEKFINEYFEKNTESKPIFETIEGTINEEGQINLKGKIHFNEEVKDIDFTLTPNKELKEGIEEVTSYKVTSDIFGENLEEELHYGK